MVSDLSRKAGGQTHFPDGRPLHVDDGVSRLIDNHLGLVAQARLAKLEVRRRKLSVGILKYNSYFIKLNLIQSTKTLTSSAIILQAILIRRQTA